MKIKLPEAEDEIPNYLHLGDLKSLNRVYRSGYFSSFAITFLFSCRSHLMIKSRRHVFDRTSIQIQ